MPTWLQIAQGPWMRFVLVVVIFGLLRLLMLTIWDIFISIRRAGDRRVPYWQILRDTLGWLLPFGRLHRTRWLYSYASFGFHVGILLAAFFLGNHIDILADTIRISWAALYKPLLDILTLVSILAGLYLLVSRLYVPGSRALSKTMDYLLLVLLINIALSGFVAGQAWNPVPYDGLMLFHTLNGMLILALAPFTKIAHCVLFPLIRLGSEVAWRFTPQGGDQVVQTLYGPEGRKV